METNFYTKTLSNQSGTTFGSEILRDILVPALVGHNEDILYWSGKLIARKLLLASNSDLRLFFEYAGWGNLKHVKSKKDLHVFELSGESIKMRLSVDENADFKIEAGFIAETYQLHDHHVAEASIDKIDKDKKIVTISIHVDPQTSINEESTSKPFSMIEFDKVQKEAQRVSSDSSNEITEKVKNEEDQKTAD